MVVVHHSESSQQGIWQLSWSASERLGLIIKKIAISSHEGEIAKILRFLNPSSECGGVLTGDTGIISSPNWPNPPDMNRACRWHIIGTVF